MIRSNKIVAARSLNGTNLDTYTRSKYYVGEYFLLDKENQFLSLNDKQAYLQQLNYLLTLSDYASQAKPRQNFNNNALDDQNHKELFLFIILNLDIKVINSDITFQKLYFYFRSHRDELEQIILKGPPQVFRPLLWRIWLMNDDLVEIDAKSLERLESTPLSPKIKKQIDSDIGRTFPEMPIFQKKYSLETLRSLLENFARYHKDLEYVQGMNNILAFISLINGFDHVNSFNMAMNIFNLRSELYVTFCFKGTFF